MNLLSNRTLASAALAWLLAAGAPGAAFAGPGAHGPNGEHLDAPPTMRAPSALPRMETHTEAFELVAELRAAELVVLVDGYESNAPVLNARLEVESGSLKATAAFRAEQGDYAFTDAALLKALAQPGEHGLVFTLLAGSDSDLLEGKLVVTARAGAPGVPDAGHDRDHRPIWERAAWTGGGLTLLAALIAFAARAWRRWRRMPAGPLKGAL
jgi:hypothetical protein